MISSLHRFHGYTSLSYAYKQGRSVRSGQLAMRYVLNRRRSKYRAAVIVSRKVDKSAVVRNRIRRRVYEIIRACAGEITEPYDIAFTIFTNQLADISSAQLQRQVRECLAKANIITSVKPPSHAIVSAKDKR